MSLSARLVLGCASAFACACPSSPSSTFDAAADAATSGASPRDASPLGGDTMDPSMYDASVSDAGSTLGGEPGGAWVDAFAAMNAALCACGYGPRGYDSAAQCAATEGSVDPGVRACAVGAYPDFAVGLGDAFECQRAAVQRAADCYAASACDVDALNACEASLAMARRACPPISDSAISGFFAAIGRCVVGDPSACPATEVRGAVGRAVFSGNTFGLGDDFLGSCGTGPAPDVAFAYTATEAGSYRFDTHGSSFDTELLAYDDCAAAHELGCAEDDGERYTSELTLTLTAGQRIVLVVDGFEGMSAGAFVVNVTRL